ncbi:hypothetical protein ISS39_07150 [Candidatus Bathyarchaeota archaeon]|nr:hypothetical protein [Candidatus Bathyarchaeota archaeon]
MERRKEYGKIVNQRKNTPSKTFPTTIQQRTPGINPPQPNGERGYTPNMKTPSNTGRNPKDTQKPPQPAVQAVQVLFSSHSVADATQDNPEKPAKQQNNPK